MISFSQVSIANCSIELSKENLMRLGRVLLPPDAEVLSSYCKQVKLIIMSYCKQVSAIIITSSAITRITIIRVSTTRCGSCRSGT